MGAKLLSAFRLGLSEKQIPVVWIPKEALRLFVAGLRDGEQKTLEAVSHINRQRAAKSFPR